MDARHLPRLCQDWRTDDRDRGDLNDRLRHPTIVRMQHDLSDGKRLVDVETFWQLLVDMTKLQRSDINILLAKLIPPEIRKEIRAIINELATERNVLRSALGNLIPLTEDVAKGRGFWVYSRSLKIRLRWKAMVGVAALDGHGS